MLHHVELWVPDLPRAVAQWGWLLGELGYEPYQEWPDGRSWRTPATGPGPAGGTYLVVERSPAMTGDVHDRRRPGLNHLAFVARDRAQVDDLAARGPDHGWSLLFADRHPWAGGQDHCAAYLENSDGFEVEVVAVPPSG